MLNTGQLYDDFTVEEGKVAGSNSGLPAPDLTPTPRRGSAYSELCQRSSGVDGTGVYPGFLKIEAMGFDSGSITNAISIIQVGG
jgi:hypothetical protein